MKFSFQSYFLIHDKLKFEFWYFIILSLLFVSAAGYSQDLKLPEKNKRPKIGLVLSGGGAKGFAHIGVLKVLEEAGVKIDYIGGTSMGAVVGGLYATGYSASQIDSIFKATDFDELLQDYIPRNSKSFYEKKNDELYAITLPFEGMKIGIPVALSKGMYNYNLLTKLTHSVRNVKDFNQLKIPFLCVASDIETGDEVILRSGYLPKAMLASSAFPSLFSPVEMSGKILIDGGVTNNYPVEEVRKMGADVIIGVDVQDELKDRRSLNDATRILIQISNLEMIRKMKQKIDLTDFYIKPDITDFSVLSFDKKQEIIRKGEEAAFVHYEKFKLLSDSDIVSQNYIPLKIDTIRLRKIRINKLEGYTRQYVLGKLNLKSEKYITYDNLKSGINNLNATQNFSGMSYTIEESGNEDDLVINLKENPNRTFLKFGLHYDGLYKSAILVNLTQKKSLFKNDVFSLDLGLGDNFRYNLDYFVDNGFYWSYGFKSRFNRFSKIISTDFNRGQLLSQLGVNSLNIDYSDFTNQAYLQTVFIHRFQIGAGVELKYLNISSETVNDVSSQIENSNYFSVIGFMKFDSYDNRYFPKKGWFFSGDFQSFLMSSDYNNLFKPFSIVKGDIGFAATLSKKITFRTNSETGFMIDNEKVNYMDFILGGYGYNTINNFKPFFGYDFLSLAANSYIKSRFTLDYEFYKKNHVYITANYANVEDDLYRTGKWLSKPTYSGYAIGYALETFLGPIEANYSWSPELKNNYTWISVGFRF